MRAYLPAPRPVGAYLRPAYFEEGLATFEADLSEDQFEGMVDEQDLRREIQRLTQLGALTVGCLIDEALAARGASGAFVHRVQVPRYRVLNGRRERVGPVDLVDRASAEEAVRSVRAGVAALRRTARSATQ